MTVFDTAEVEIIPDFTQFEQQLRQGIDEAMRQLQRTVDGALIQVEDSFDDTAAEATDSLNTISGDFDDTVSDAEQAGGEIADAFDAAADDSADALTGVDADFSEPESAADQAATSIETAFDSAADGIADAFDGAGQQAADDIAPMADAMDEGADSADLLRGSLVALVGVAGGLAILRTAALNAEALNSEMALLNNAADDVGLVLGRTTGELRQVAEAASIRFGIDVTDVTQAQRVINRFAQTTEIDVDRVLQVATDMSFELGQAVPQAAQTLARSLADPERAMLRLERQGIFLDAATRSTITSLQDMGDVAGAQAVLLDQLEDAFGGAADAAADTTARIGQAGQALLRTLGDPIIAALDQNVDTFVSLVESLAPAAENIGLLFGQLLELVAALSPAIEVLADGIAALPPELFLIVGGALAARTALLGINSALLVLRRNPAILAVGALAAALAALRLRSDEAVDGVTQATDAILDMDAGVRGTNPFDDLIGNIDQFMGEIVFFRDVVAELENDFAAFDAALAGLVRQGDADTAARQFARMREQLLDVGLTTEEVEEAFAEYRGELRRVENESARAAIEMEELGAATVAVADALNAVEVDTSALAFIDLARALDESEEAALDMEAAADRLEIPLEELQQIVPEVIASFEALASAVRTTMPSVADAVDTALSAAEQAGDDFTMQGFADELERQLVNAQNFNDNVTALVEAGFNDLAALALEKGPEFAAAAADSLGDPEILERVEGLMGDVDGEMDRGLGIAADTAAAQAGVVMSEIEDNLRPTVPMVEDLFSRDIPDGIAAAGTDMSREAASVVNQAKEAAQGAVTGADTIGGSITDGIATGMTSGSAIGNIISRARSVVSAAIAAAREAAQIGSPSRLFAEQIGQPITEGIAAGMLDAETQVLNAVRRIVDDAATEMRDAGSIAADITGGRGAAAAGLDTRTADALGGRGIPGTTIIEHQTIEMRVSNDDPLPLDTIQRNLSMSGGS